MATKVFSVSFVLLQISFLGVTPFVDDGFAATYKNIFKNIFYLKNLFKS